MNGLAIRVGNLSKLYCIGQQERYPALRDVLARSLSAPIRWFKNSKSDCIWALKDVSFEVRHGEVIGIPSATLRAGIGRNGAGKTAEQGSRGAGEQRCLSE